MIVVLWMVLPQTQGATQLYLHYLHPQLVLHERDLDKLIFTLHQQAMQSGAAQLQRLYRLVQEILIGPAARAPENSATPTSSTGPAEQDGFIANLLARFRTVPVGSSAETIPATLLAFISSYSRSATSMTPSSAADIVPSHLQPEERANYIALQKQKVNNWLQLLDQAMSQPAPSYVDASIPTAIPEGNESHTSLSSKKGKARSASGRQTPMTDSDFEDIGQDDILPMRRAPGAKTSARDTSSFGNVNTRQGWFWRSGRSASSTY
ncbi:hypothetical protein BCR37DRAFT_381394 [Protomyces lactucae-debilis]|uniref:Uncharacterized protein n=1 Tax=Protomyces lactucae-debilis TaxID=2754530 RepID=A0A1Y2F7U3_PROLT|nr:uncharacterized protein BCR37DRAFT_381394 [Protomyces lactucae-debilis]ORY79968.1 hypothetical protein BCR37DRAFT_381394 [Protomyces lactucae-debilis]